MFLPTCIIVCMGPLSFGKLKLFFVLHCAWSENYCFQSLLSREKTTKRKSMALLVLDRIIAVAPRKFRGRRIYSQRTQGCQNRDPDRKIARFYDPTSPKRLKSQQDRKNIRIVCRIVQDRMGSYRSYHLAFLASFFFFFFFKWDSFGSFG